MSVSGSDLSVVDSAKILGLTISSDLSWNAHVEDDIRSLRKQTNASTFLSYSVGLVFHAGSGRGVLIPDSRSFFTRIPHPAIFLSRSRISFFLSQKYIEKRLISAKAGPFD